MDPEVVYRVVQSGEQEDMDGEGDMKSNLLADPLVNTEITVEVLDELMDPWRDLQFVDAIYERFGIEGGENDNKSRRPNS